MNLYFLVEGQESEVALYPFWLSHLVPALSRVNAIRDISSNNYYLVSGYGYPAMLDNNNLANSVAEVNRHGIFNYLVVCLDSDGISAESKRDQIQDFLRSKNLTLDNDCQLITLIHNPCIETWLLGTRIYYPSVEINRNYTIHRQHYNVFENDPELMARHPSFKLPISRYHFVHLVEMLKPRIRYSKSNAQGVLSKYYLDDLLARLELFPDQLQSFKYFVEFCITINEQLRN